MLDKFCVYLILGIGLLIIIALFAVKLSEPAHHFN